MQYDTTTYINDSMIQYGQMNDRIYLMKLGNENPSFIVGELDKLAEEEHLGKIFAKVPANAEKPFYEAGYLCEARIPGFYKGEEEAVFLGKFINRSRIAPTDPQKLSDVLAITEAKSGKVDSAPELKKGFTYHHCREEDAEEMSKVYAEVFPTYPFPIHDPKYLIKTMHSNVLYFSIRHKGEIVSLSSAEMDKNNLNVEMTDFATLPDWRGNSFATFLLAKMEADMRKLGIKTAYTIARALSPGMNITFARMGYTYSGRLINNTNISGKIESMNIWYKSLV
ncbi:MAG: putative beta-lysine N-acetyltransferase [Planctomycetes bacterium]|nr:putative beta-lysine N-acetyltransferase [Planctomycetota bacterium]